VLIADAYFRRVTRVCLARVPLDADLAALGGDRERWLCYRRMVRRRIRDSIAAVFLRFEVAVGASAFTALLDAFFASGRLASPVIRDVPGELLAFLCHGADVFELPAFALDLARLEWAERAVSYAEDDEDPVGPLVMSGQVALTRAHRLLSSRHAVHEFDPDSPRAPEARPTLFCVYRDGPSGDARVLTLSAVAHALMAELGTNASLQDAIARAAARSDATVDRAFIESLSDLLADLSARGIVRGARVAART